MKRLDALIRAWMCQFGGDKPNTSTSQIVSLFDSAPVRLSWCCLNTFAVVAKLEGYLSAPGPAPFDAVAYTARDSMEHRNIPYLVALGWREELELY